MVKRTGLELVLSATVPKSRGFGVIENGVGPPIGVAVDVAVAVFVGVLVAVAVAVFVGVGLAEGVNVGVGDAVNVFVGVGEAVSVFVGVGPSNWFSTAPLSQLPFETGNHGRGKCR